MVAEVEAPAHAVLSSGGSGVKMGGDVALYLLKANTVSLV